MGVLNQPTGPQIGGVTESAPITDTGSSGLNGRMQRIAQRLTSLIALLPAALGANGGLKIEGVSSGTVVPISGTVTTNAGSGTSAVSLATLPALVAGSAVVGKVGIDQTSDGTTNLVAAKQSGTWNVTNLSGTVSLPTGAATAAKQPAIGTAGSPSVDLITVQGHPSGQALPVAIMSGGGSGGTALADESTFTTATTSVTPIAGIYNSTPDTLATGKTGALQMTAARGLHTHIVDAAGASVSTAIAKTTDTVTAALDTSTIQVGTTSLVPKFAKIAASSSGNNTLVSAVSTKKIRVLAYNFMGAGAVNAKFQDGASGTDLTGLKYIAAAGGGICAPFNPVGWFETTASTLLNLNLSGAVAVGGELVYVEV